jgi:hypothetical protein
MDPTDPDPVPKHWYIGDLRQQLLQEFGTEGYWDVPYRISYEGYYYRY